MKKFISVFLTLCLSASVLCACNNTTNTSVDENINSSVSENSDDTASLVSENTVSNTDNQNSEVSDNSTESSLTVNSTINQQSSITSSNVSNTSVAETSNTSTVTSIPSTNSNNTTSKPSTNPSSTTSKPNTNPSSTTSKPNTNPSSTTSKPNTNPSSTTSKPNTNPSSTTSKPNTNPSSTTSKPNTNPSSTTSKPSTNPSGTTSKPSTNPTSQPNSNTDNKEQEAIYKELFDINSKISVQIDISDSELLKIQQDYDRYKNKGSKSPIYRIANKVTFTINGKKYEIEDVGVRLKGNTSRTDFYSSSNGIYNMTHLRLSFDETFDDTSYYGSSAKKWNDADRKERKKRTFATLNSLEIKWNRNYDQTYIREYYTSQMYRENGILCAKNNISQMNISGNNMGIYMIYEPVDKKFIERNLPKEDWGGDLYKVGWTNSPADYTRNVSYGIEDEDKSKFYNFDLKTNKKTSTHQSLKNLLKVINKSNVTKSEFASVVDTDYWVKFVAVSYFIGNPDDLRNNYNNHYIYFLKSNGKAIFIPYDNDRTLGVTCGYNPTGNGMTSVSPFSTKAEGNNSSQRNPLYTKTVLNNGFYVNQYKTELEKIAGSKWLTMNNFKPIYEKAKSNYGNYVMPNKQYNNVDSSRLSFSLEGRYSSGDKYNIAIDDYFSRILKTYQRYK